MSNPSYLQGRVSCPGGDEGSICPCQQGAFRCPGLPNRALAVMPSPVAFKTLAVSEVEVHLHVVVYSANSELLLEHRNNQSQDSLFQWGAPWWLKEKQNKTKKPPTKSSVLTAKAENDSSLLSVYFHTFGTCCSPSTRPARGKAPYGDGAKQSLSAAYSSKNINWREQT